MELQLVRVSWDGYDGRTMEKRGPPFSIEQNGGEKRFVVCFWRGNRTDRARRVFAYSASRVKSYAGCVTAATAKWKPSTAPPSPPLSPEVTPTIRLWHSTAQRPRQMLVYYFCGRAIKNCISIPNGYRFFFFFLVFRQIILFYYLPLIFFIYFIRRFNRRDFKTIIIYYRLLRRIGNILLYQLSFGFIVIGFILTDGGQWKKINNYILKIIFHIELNDCHRTTEGYGKRLTDLC